MRDLGVFPATTIVTASDRPLSVVERASASIAPVQQAHLITSVDQWTWMDLRDYVVGSIVSRLGPIPRDDKREMGIFRGFVARWPAVEGKVSAGRIAKHAFEDLDGWWRGSPVGIGRFAKASDPYFASVIADRLLAG